MAGQIIEPVLLSCALSEFCDDAQSNWVAADTGQMLTQKVGGSAEVAGGRRADYFDVMTFPVHLPTAAHSIRRCFGESGEISDGELENGIGPDGLPERSYRLGRIRGLLRLAIEGGRLGVGRDHPTVVLDRRTSRIRLAAASVGPFSVGVHDYQVALVT